MKTQAGLTPIALGSLLAVATSDAVARARRWPRSFGGLLDETAHAATGALLLANWPRGEAAPAAAVLAGSILLDVDHLPELWGRAWLRRPGARPVPHCLATVGATAVLARRGRAFRGVSAGLSGHLLRDLATGRTGVPLLWPLSARPFSIPYPVYAAVLGALALGTRRNEPASAPPAAIRDESGSEPRPRA